MGLSFAIPIDVAMKVEGQLLAHGKVTRGKLGVTIQEVNQALAESFGLPKVAGALVSAVDDGSPAAKGGLQPGDVILALDGQELASSSDLPQRVADLKPGARANLDVGERGATRRSAWLSARSRRSRWPATTALRRKAGWASQSGLSRPRSSARPTCEVAWSWRG
jgi:S1-C subfamily serine protease